MGLINRFDSIAQEQDYVRSERTVRRPALRVLTVIAGIIFLGFSLLNPLLFPADLLPLLNLVSTGMIVALAAAWYVIGTEFYLRWRWLDPLMFWLLAVCAVVLMRALAGSEAVTQTSFLVMTVINLGVIFVFAAVAFVANLRWYLVWAGVMMAIYLAFLANQPIGLIARVYMAANVAMFLSFAIFVNWSLDQRARQVFAANRALAAEQARTEELLYNVLPQAVAARLRAGEAIADSFADVTVIFADIVGFSTLAKQLSPGHLVKLLNRFFLLADRCAERHGVEKVKTIGDAYLAVSGGTASAEQGARDAINFARELIGEMRKLAAETNVDIRLRVGLHTGPVVGGVVGSSRLAYDYWGDTMNIASRIESVAHPNGIAVSSATFFQLGGGADFSEPEVLVLKGVGETEVRHLAC
ncbi:MAG: adenylate/guanylate cyclase domain-containing protein [Porphyrobacter sp.]|jgi:adenylate cyclase|nr:adenylate/guanylate cyclase domain-containing protein [Porphyrobacter sp.]